MMDYYTELDMSKYLGHNVVLGLHKGGYIFGKITDCPVNEDYEEDSEPETLGIRTLRGLQEVALQDIKFIAKQSEANIIGEAV